MKLIEIFLPLYDNAGRKLPKSIFAETRRELVARPLAAAALAGP